MKSAVHSSLFAFVALTGILLSVETESSQIQDLTYVIKTDWQNVSVDESAFIYFRFSKSIPGEEEEGMVVELDAPWYNDTLPPAEPGRLDGLADFEVVEAFFLGDDDNYLELEFGPGGHYLVYYLEGYRNVTNGTLLLSSYSVEINEEEERWTGRAIIPFNYFPPLESVSKLNCYSIHGENETRTYMSLYPAPFASFDEPDFHRLELFEDVDLTSILPEED